MQAAPGWPKPLYRQAAALTAMQQHSQAAQLLQQLQELLPPNTPEVRVAAYSCLKLCAVYKHMRGSPDVSHSSALCHSASDACGCLPSVVCCCLPSMPQTQPDLAHTACRVGSYKCIAAHMLQAAAVAGKLGEAHAAAAAQEQHQRVQAELRADHAAWATTQASEVTRSLQL
jgi:hypothetical protein